MADNDAQIFPLYGYDVNAQPTGPIDPGPAMGPSSLQVNGQPAGYNVPADYTGPLLVGSPGGGRSVVLTDPTAIAEYGHSRRTRVMRGAAAVAALPLMPLVSGIGTGLSSHGGSPTRLSWQDPQVNFPPPNPRVYIPGTEPPYTGNRLPVPYEVLPPQAGPGVGLVGIGAILTGVIGALWPSPLGGDDTFGRTEQARHEGREHPLPTPPEDIVFGPVPEMDIGPPGEADPSLIYNPKFPPPRPEQLPAPAGDIVFGPTPEVGPPQGARQPAPTPAQARRMPPWVWPAIGGLAAIQLGRAGRTRSSMTLPEVALTSSLDLGALEPLLSSLQNTGASSAPITLAGSSFDYPREDCNCGPKKRGKKRKCLAWAQLSWRSGPKKGRAAGRRCYRYAAD